MKQAAWSVMGFCAAVAVVAFVVLLSPDAHAGSGEGALPVFSSMSPTQWADLIVGLVFGFVALACGIFVSQEARDEQDELVVDLLQAVESTS